MIQKRKGDAELERWELKGGGGGRGGGGGVSWCVGACKGLVCVRCEALRNIHK